jgi:enamine deaminase RidA (YjgF/YER057c/UK114 family)
MQIHAVSGTPVQTLTHDGRIVGRTFYEGEAKHCLLGDIGPSNVSLPAPEQARETLENLEAALGLAGMAMSDVARTWFFLDDILAWYGSFNEVRNGFFARRKMRKDSLPASTGVAGKNPRGEALVAGAWAVKSHDDAPVVRIVPSPKQCPAPAYGSAFSRAIEIVSPHRRRLLVSGTASISPDGRTAHVGDTRRQIELTMEVVAAILKPRGMALADATRATAYFKSAADHPLFTAWCGDNGFEELPVVSACGDICRDDLLFEIELDAVTCAD